uniref:Uncharacterized protein n=1 Tax=Opuntia streptacantha TaxID=393608 RepID=A0A7C9AX12_OPUST
MHREVWHRPTFSSESPFPPLTATILQLSTYIYIYELNILNRPKSFGLSHSPHYFSSELNLFQASFRRSKTFSHMYFCWMLAPRCCNLSGCTQRVAFLYAFFTAAAVITSVNGMGCQPLSGPRIYCRVDNNARKFPSLPLDHLLISASRVSANLFLSACSL